MKKLQVKRANPGKTAKRPAKPKKGRIKADEALSRREVELMRDLFETGFWSIEALADKFEVSAARCQSLVKFKTHR